MYITHIVLFSAIESGSVKISNKNSDEEYGNLHFPIEAALWSYWATPSTIVGKPQFRAILK